MFTIKHIKRSLVFLGMIFTLNACVVTGHPDSHVDAHLHGSLHGWYYYPSAEVYFHITDRYYYYLDGTVWRRANHLPRGWVLNHNHRVRINLTGRPYVNHSHHRRQYPGRRPNHNRPGRHDRDDRHGHNDNHGNRPNHEHDREGRRDEDRNEKRKMYLPHTKGNVKIEKRGKSGKGETNYSKGSGDKKWKNKEKQAAEKGKEKSKGKGKVSRKGNGKAKYKGKREDDDDDRRSNDDRGVDNENMKKRDRYR